MKAALLVAAGLCVALPASSQDIDNPDEIRTLKISKIDRRLYDPSPSGMTLSGRIVTVHDRQGNLVESIGYGPSGELRSRSRYKYDAQNRLVEYVTEPAHEGFHNFTRSYELDPKGRVIEARDYDAVGVMRGSRRFKHDEAGRVVEETTYDAAGRPSWIQRRRYDPDGNQVEWTSLNGEGEVVQRREFTFRKKGQQAQMRVYDSSNRLFAKTEYEYAGEQLSQASHFSADGKLESRFVFERDKGGLVIKETIFQDGKVTSVEETSYEHHP